MRILLFLGLVLLQSLLQSAYSLGSNITKDSLTTKEPFISSDNMFYSNSDFSWRPYIYNDPGKIKINSISLFDITMFSNQNNLFQADLFTFRSRYFNFTLLTEFCETKSIVDFFDEDFDNISHMAYVLSFGLRYPIICSEKHRLTINSVLYWFDKSNDLDEKFRLHPFLDSQLRYEYKYGIAAIGGYRQQLYDSKAASNSTDSYFYNNNLNGFYIGLSFGLTYNINTNKGVSYWRKAKSENTIYSYQSFLGGYPNSRYAKEAKNRIELLCFNKAIKSDVNAECNYYLREYPNGRYYEQVKHLLLSKIDKEEKDLYKLAISGSFIDCSYYLRKYPKGRYYEEITKLQQDKYQLDENKYYLNAKSGDYADCEYYMKTFSKGEHFNEINLISKFKVRIEKSGRWIINKLSDGLNSNGSLTILSAGDKEFICELNNPQIKNVKIINGAYNDSISLFHTVVGIKTAYNSTLQVVGAAGSINNPVNGKSYSLVGLPNSRFDISLLKKGFKYNGLMWYPTKDSGCYIFCTENSIIGVNVLIKP
jgi:hypothetical protein